MIFQDKQTVLIAERQTALCYPVNPVSVLRCLILG